MTPLGRLFVPGHFLDAVSDHAWLGRPELFDLNALLEQGRSVGNPAEPLVRALRDEAA